MFEALEYYQSLAEKFDSRILTVSGIVVVIIGLCIWLAGLRWRKILGAIAGGGIFASAVVCIGSYDTPVVLTVIFIGIVVGALVEKITLGIFGAAAAAIVVLAVTSTNIRARQYSDIEYLDTLEEPSEEELLSGLYYPTWPEYEYSDIVITVPQAVEITREMASYFVAKTVENIKSSYAVAFASAIVMLIAAGFTAVLVPRIFIAVAASSLGSAIIFAGMVMLLFYKRSEPVTCIAERSRFFTMTLIAMVIFGTMVQLALSRPAVAKASSDKSKDEKKGR